MGDRADVYVCDASEANEELGFAPEVQECL